MERGKLIILEGAEEVSKTSVGRELCKIMNENGKETIFTFQPGDSAYAPHAPFIRALCKDKRYNLHELSQMYAFLLDRSEQCDKIIKPALEAGINVISDRWSYSTYAYQLYGKGLKKKYNLPDSICDHLGERAILGIDPDITFYFTEKVGNRENDKHDAFDHETELFFGRVNKAYDRLAKYYHWVKPEIGNSAIETAKWIFDYLS